MKKIILLVLGMVFLTNCGNNGNTNSDSVAVAPEKRESFTKNPYFENYNEEFLRKEFVSYIKEHEYNTFLEAFEKRYNKKSAEKLYEMQKNNIEKVERMTKSKFYFVEGKEFFCFTPKRYNFMTWETAYAK